jgi:hypothetical protein
MDELASDEAVGDDRRRMVLRVCGLDEVACRSRRGAEAARRALIAAVRNIVGGMAGGWMVEVPNTWCRVGIGSFVKKFAELMSSCCAELGNTGCRREYL